MFLNQPTDEQQVLIRRVLGEDVTQRDYHLEIIKDWLKKQPHLPDTYDDRRLMNFLRGCSFSLEKCKYKLDMYFTMRTAVPEFFTNRDISRPELQEILKYCYNFYLPTLTPDGKRVAIACTIGTDFETPDLADVFKIITMVVDVRLEAEEYGVVGDVYVVDGSAALLKHFKKISPLAIKKFAICFQEAFPIKVKEIHIFNLTPFVDFFLDLVKQFLKEKIRNRIHVHHDLESLYRHVPKNILPEEYGGTAGKLKDLRAQWLKIIEERTTWFKEQENIKADESKRPGKQLNYDNFFGVEGSFKQLNID